MRLHRSLDELLADFIGHNHDKYPSRTTIMELVRWSHQQTLDPTEDPNCPDQEDPMTDASNAAPAPATNENPDPAIPAAAAAQATPCLSPRRALAQAGHRVARAGWNGKDMSIALQSPTSTARWGDPTSTCPQSTARLCRGWPARRTSSPTTEP